MPNQEIRKKVSGDTIRLLAIADAHISAHTPPSWRVDYLEHTEQTIRQLINFAIKQKVTAVIWAGDQFHLKSPSRSPLGFMSKVISWFKELEDAGIENWGIAGNHDLKYGSLEGLKGQPLEVLISAGVFRLLDWQELVIETEDDYSVRVAGASYFHGKADECRDKKKSGADYLISAGHFWFGKVSGEFFGEPLYGPDWLGKGEVDMYILGHHHEDQGIPVVDGKYYLSQGSINRTGAHKQDMDRRVAAAYTEISRAGVVAKILRPKVLPSDEIIDKVVREQVMEEKKEMEEFIASLHNTQVTALEPVEVLTQMQADQAVKERAKAFLEEAEKSA